MVELYLIAFQQSITPFWPVLGSNVQWDGSRGCGVVRLSSKRIDTPDFSCWPFCVGGAPAKSREALSKAAI
jgi:hypothetical protein